MSAGTISDVRMSKCSNRRGTRRSVCGVGGWIKSRAQRFEPTTRLAGRQFFGKLAFWPFAARLAA